AGRRGARVILVARGAEALARALAKVRADGGAGLSVVADASREEDMIRVADRAREEFGRFDTWVNGASVAIYGRVEEVPLADMRRLFETNFWGMVHGSLAALPELRRRGGALINIGSMLSDLAIPLQGPYAASKHAL